MATPWPRLMGELLTESGRHAKLAALAVLELDREE
jgi:hypothetical protein